MSMKLADIVATFVQSLGSAGNFLDGQYDGILNAAVLDYSRSKPLQEIGLLTLEAGKSVYDAPANLDGIKHHDWGRANRRRRDPWNSRVVKIPDVKIIPGENGQRPYRIALSYAPTAEEIGICGSSFQYFYTAVHLVSDLDPGTVGATTVPAADRDILIVRMQAEAMLQLSLNRTGKVAIADPKTKGQNRAGTPKDLHQYLMDEFNRRLMA